MRAWLVFLFSLTLAAEAVACQMNQFDLSDVKKADLVIKAELVSYKWQRTDHWANGFIRLRTIESLKGEERKDWELYWRGSRSRDWNFGDIFIAAAINPRKLRWFNLATDGSVKPPDRSDLFHVLEPLCSGPFIFPTSLTDAQRRSIQGSVIKGRNEIPLLTDEPATPTDAEADLVAEIEEARTAEIDARIEKIRALLKPRRKIPRGD